MKSFLTYCLLIVAIVTLVIFATFVWTAAVELKEDSAALRSTIEDVHKSARDTSQNVNAVLLQWGLASDELRRAAMEQRRSLLKSDAQMQELMTSANVSVRDLDTMIVSLNASQAAVTSKASDTLGDLQTTLRSSDQLMTTTTATMAMVGTRLNDPHLVHMFASADEGVTHLDNSSAIIEGELRKWTAPASKVKTVLGQGVRWAGQAAFNHLIP